MDATGVNTFVELVGDDTEVSVLHDDVAWDGGQDLLAIFVPAGEEKPPPPPPSPSLCDHVFWVCAEQNKLLSACWTC